MILLLCYPLRRYMKQVCSPVLPRRHRKSSIKKRSRRPLTGFCQETTNDSTTFCKTVTHPVPDAVSCQALRSVETHYDAPGVISFPSSSLGQEQQAQEADGSLHWDNM